MQEEQEIYLGRQILRQNGVGGLGFYKTVKACDLYTSIRPKKTNYKHFDFSKFNRFY